MGILDSCLCFVERGGVAQGILWRLGYHFVMTGTNVDGLLEHSISGPERSSYLTIFSQMLASVIQVQG
jgi:hypothetical protein